MNDSTGSLFQDVAELLSELVELGPSGVEQFRRHIEDFRERVKGAYPPPPVIHPVPLPEGKRIFDQATQVKVDAMQKNPYTEKTT